MTSGENRHPSLREGFQKNRYFFTTDHKMIGRQYFFLSLAAVLVGAWLSLLMRIHLARGDIEAANEALQQLVQTS